MIYWGAIATRGDHRLERIYANSFINEKMKKGGCKSRHRGVKSRHWYTSKLPMLAYVWKSWSLKLFIANLTSPPGGEVNPGCNRPPESQGNVDLNLSMSDVGFRLSFTLLVILSLWVLAVWIHRHRWAVIWAINMLWRERASVTTLRF